MAAKFFGQFLLEQGLINKDQLLAALETQRSSNPLLGELAQAQGMLTAAQARRINDIQRREDKRFGDIALALGLLSSEQIDSLLAQQKAGRKLFGEILLEQGALSEEQLQSALRQQQAERDFAVQALDLGIADSPMGGAISVAIATCERQFTRVLRGRCQFSSLARDADDFAFCTVTGHVRVDAKQPLVVVLASDHSTMRNIAAAYMRLPAAEVDDALAQDAMGELINVLMGYLVMDLLPEDMSYKASPPDFGASVQELTKSHAPTLAVTMDSELGNFILMVGR